VRDGWHGVFGSMLLCSAESCGACGIAEIDARMQQDACLLAAVVCAGCSARLRRDACRMLQLCSMSNDVCKAGSKPMSVHQVM
jgi:hypothetical protein